MKKIIGVLLFSAFAFCMIVSTEKTAEAQPIIVYGAYCCDAAAFHRCVLPSYAPVGTPCFCYGQGTGWTCQ